MAQADAEYKWARCGRKTKLNAKLKQTILNHLQLSWSPEVIAHELKLATKSIYNKFLTTFKSPVNSLTVLKI
ncbi:hypothetical protein LMI01_10660 [Companilactobacillus mindensis]|nr:hypothetical protein LMI01_10660 [Companilactobacillus mindensis]